MPLVDLWIDLKRDSVNLPLLLQAPPARLVLEVFAARRVSLRSARSLMIGYQIRSHAIKPGLVKAPRSLQATSTHVLHSRFRGALATRP